MKKLLIIAILVAATQAKAVELSRTTNTSCAVVSEPELRRCSGSRIRQTHLSLCVSFPTGEVNGFFMSRKGYSKSTVTGVVYCDAGRLCATVSEPGYGVQDGTLCQGDPTFDSVAACLGIAQIAVTWLTCGIGGLWPLIDAIMILTGKVPDAQGRPLRD